MAETIYRLSARPKANASTWTGRIISTLVVLMYVMDGAMKLAKPVFVVEAMHRMGWNPDTSIGIGIVLLISTLAYSIRQTAVLGAILLTGFLGGAVAAHVQAGSPPFETVFPVIFAGLTWLGIYVRDERIRALVPLRS